MVEVTVVGETIPAERVSEGWLNKMLVEARKHGGMLCVQVRIKEPTIDMSLNTPGCGGVPGGRQPNAKELAIFEAWARHGLAAGQFSPGELTAFLAELRRIL